MLLIPAAALVGVAGLLWWRSTDDQPPPRDRDVEAAARPPEPNGTAAPGGAEDLLEQVRTGTRADADAALERFVRKCLAAGPRAIPDLIARLNAGEDHPIRPRWRFNEGRAVPYATVRAAYLDALASIPGPAAERALQSLVPHTKSVAETYQIALALVAREADGWVDAGITRAAEPTTAVAMPIQKDLLALAAKREPTVVAERMLTLAPRGDDATDPAVLASALHVLDHDRANATMTTLVKAQDVTPRAKARFLREMFNRPQGEAKTFDDAAKWITDEVVPASLRTLAAYTAVNATSFELDRIEYERALASGRLADASAVKARFLERYQAVEAFVDATVGQPVAGSSDPRAASLRRALERVRKKVR